VVELGWNNSRTRVGVAELSAGRVAWARNAEAMSRLGNDSDFYFFSNRWFSPTLKSIPFIHRLPGLSSTMFGEVRRGSARFGDVIRCSAMFGDVRRCSTMFGHVRRCSAMFGDVRRYYPMFSDIIRASIHDRDSRLLLHSEASSRANILFRSSNLLWTRIHVRSSFLLC